MKVKVYNLSEYVDARPVFTHCLLKREIIFMANCSLQEIMSSEVLKRKIKFLEERPKEVSLVLLPFIERKDMNAIYNYVDRTREGTYQLIKYDYDDIIILVPLEKNYYNSERKN